MTIINSLQTSEDTGNPYDQFILFGDSITQMSYNQDIGFGFGAQLQEGGLISHYSWHNILTLYSVYARKLDVINRGFS